MLAADDDPDAPTHTQQHAHNTMGCVTKRQTFQLTFKFQLLMTKMPPLQQHSKTVQQIQTDPFHTQLTFHCTFITRPTHQLTFKFVAGCVLLS